MKRMKKIASLLLAVAMVLGMCMTTFAADSEQHQIYIKQNENDHAKHTYEAYQIFSGDIADNPAYKTLTCESTEEGHEHIEDCYTINESVSRYYLSNIEWGSGVDAKSKRCNIPDHDHTDTCGAKTLLEALSEEDTFGGLFDDDTTAAQVAMTLGSINEENGEANFPSSTVSASTILDTFATIVSNYLKTPNAIVENAEGDTSITVTGSGYYLIKDKDGSLEQKRDEHGNPVTDDEGNPVMVDSAYTRFLLQVVGDANVTVKSGVPSGTKEVFYTGVGAYNNGGEYVPNPNPSPALTDANFAGIGDHASYEIKSSVPNYVGYDYYIFVMKDKLSDGLTFDGVKSINVTITKKGETTPTTLSKGWYEGEGTQRVLKVVDASGNEVANPKVEDADYYVYPNEDGYTFKLAFRDIMETTTVGDDEVQKWPVGSDISLTYSATVNENAIIGIKGNVNAWSLDYSKNPNFEYDGKTKEGKPGLPIEDIEDVMGETPVDITLTYLTELDLTKYKEDAVAGNELAGATFTLQGTSAQAVVKNVEYFEIASTGNTANAEKNEDGSVKYYYKLLEVDAAGNPYYTSTAPKFGEGDDGFVKIGVGTASTTVGYIKNSAGEYVIPTDVKEYEGKDIYKHVKGTNEKYADAYTKYVKLTATETVAVPTNVSIEYTTLANGKIYFKGLGAGHYVLMETGTPAGYNTLDPIEFDIVFIPPTNGVIDETSTCGWTVENITVNGVAITSGSRTVEVNGEDNTYHVLATSIVNKSGSLLPSTGGIGTTIFYVVGGILVIGAGILLVAKKRMGSKN